MYRLWLTYLATSMGFEPTTSSVTGRRSPSWATTPYMAILKTKLMQAQVSVNLLPKFWATGANDGTRTHTPIKHQNLNLTSLPIPPHSHIKDGIPIVGDTAFSKGNKKWMKRNATAIFTKTAVDFIYKQCFHWIYQFTYHLVFHNKNG